MASEVEMAARTPNVHRSTRDGQIALYSLFAIMGFIGWEWLNSGLTKVVRGHFSSGLPSQLHTQSAEAPSWFRDFIHDTVIPNHAIFAALIEVGEITVGAALIGAAIIWWRRGPVLADRGRTILLSTVVLAGLAGTLMNLNFHLSSGGHHPWFLAKDAFGEGVDLDSLLPMLQLTIVAVSGKLLLDTRRDRRKRMSTASALSAPPGVKATSTAPALSAPLGVKATAATVAGAGASARVEAAMKSLTSVSKK